MSRNLKPSILSALVLAFASLGDAFLYIVLPVNALQMNVPFAWIGILLSINRFVRILANQLFARLFHRFGFKQITFVAAIFSMATTFIYGLAGGIAVWLVVRIVWGFCYSALRMSAIGYSLQTDKKGFSLGLNKGLQEIGPVIALLTGPILLQWTSLESTFLIFSIVGGVALIISLYLPQINIDSAKISFSIKILPSSFNFITFLSSLFVQGILIVTISQLLAPANSSLIVIASIAGVYLAYRRICTILIAPFGGVFADKFGLDSTFLISAFLTGIGLFLIAIGMTETGIIVAFTFNSIGSALAPGHVTEGTTHLKTIASNSTWNDLGTALGALISGVLLATDHLQPIFGIATFTILLACIYHAKSINFQLTGWLKWK